MHSREEMQIDKFQICSQVKQRDGSGVRTVKINVNRAPLKWSRSCHPSGTALHTLVLRPLDVTTGQNGFGLGLEQHVSLTTVCKGNQKENIMITRLKTKNIL